MRALRFLLASLYAVVGFFTLSSLAMMWRLLPADHGNFYGWLAAGFLPFCGGLFAMAAVSYFFQWRSARIWCLAVSALNLAVPFLMVVIESHFSGDSTGVVLWGNSLLLGLAVAGGIAFWRWDPVREKELAKTENAAKPGDGTWSLLNHALPVFVVLVFSWLWIRWGMWGESAGLPAGSFWSRIAQATIAELVVVVLHEAGHALCGLALGSRVRAFFAGPFRFQIQQGKWKFRFRPAAILSMGGGTGVVPGRADEPDSYQFAMIAAGPAVNAITGLIALWTVFWIANSTWQSQWFLVAMFATISLETAIVNLIPVRTAAGYSDGARILQLLRGSVWADLHNVIRVVQATTVSGLRPRDYDLAAIHRVMDAGIANGAQAVHLHLYAHSCYLDRGQPELALEQVTAAEAIYESCAAQVPAELLSIFVMGEAMARRDRERARLWWDRMEAKKPAVLNGDYWMAKSALHWIEGEEEEAKSAWSQAHAYLETMPLVGAYAFDKDVLAGLEAVMQATATEEAAVAPANASSVAQSSPLLA